jgi:alpha-1,3-glucan synthase
MGGAFIHYLYCVAILLTLLLNVCHAAPFIEEEVLYNLNTNQSATNPLDYWGVWSNHSYNPSPTNWRFPFYSFFLDR